ncbi:MAG: hypothetical protein LBT92_00705 [Rickettsiales bacterium]|jgi:hypothetical protein|nr:hypothetical protein [Rickettsiales bacterium]
MSLGRIGYSRANLPSSRKSDFQKRLGDLKYYAYDLGQIYPSVTVHVAQYVTSRRYKRLRYEFDHVFFHLNGQFRSYSGPKESFLARMRKYAPALYDEFIFGEDTYTIHHAYPLSVGGTNKDYTVALVEEHHDEVSSITQDQLKERGINIRKPFEPFLLLLPKLDGRMLYRREEYEEVSDNFFRQFPAAFAWARAKGV